MKLLYSPYAGIVQIRFVELSHVTLSALSGTLKQHIAGLLEVNYGAVWKQSQTGLRQAGVRGSLHVQRCHYNGE